MGKKKLTQADREMLERARANAERLRLLAEKGQAELDRRKQERESD